MSEKNLETSEIVGLIKKANEKIKRMEVDKSQKEGRLATLYERLKAETGTDDRVQARKIVRQKEKEIDTNNSRFRDLFSQLEGRDEWKLLIE